MAEKHNNSSNVHNALFYNVTTLEIIRKFVNLLWQISKLSENVTVML